MSNAPLALDQISFAADSHIGTSPRRRYLEDRANVLRVTTEGGLEMLLALVADGAGGKAGEWAAEAVWRSVRSVITASPIKKLSRAASAAAKALLFSNAQVCKRGACQSKPHRYEQHGYRCGNL